MSNYIKKDLDILEDRVRDAQKGDKDAKLYIIDFFNPFVIKMSKKIFIKGMDESDIKQHLILSLLTAINKYNKENHFFWYAIQTMKNNIYNQLKKNKKEEGNINIEKVILIDYLYVEDTVLKKEEVIELQKVLHKLKEDDYKLIYNFYYEDYDLNKLSEYFNVSYSTIATRKNRALKKIKLLM